MPTWLFHLLLCTIFVWACGDDKKEKATSPSPAPTAVPATIPPADSGPQQNSEPPAEPNDDSGKPNEKSPKDPEEPEEEEEEEEEDENRFLTLQRRVCEKADGKCEVYGLNAKASKNGFCPYSQDCANGKCKVQEVLDHYCNCIYQLEKGNTVFNGGKQNCIPEYREAEEEAD